MEEKKLFKYVVHSFIPPSWVGASDVKENPEDN